MKPIKSIRSEIFRIPFAKWSGNVHPFRRPQIRSDSYQTIEKNQGDMGGELVFDSNDEFEYPDWIDQEFFDRMDHVVRESGIDALAWYVSFHVTHPEWGIFIPVSSLAYLEKRYLQKLRRPRYGKWQIAFKLLLEHELFHFATDYACAQWEILMQRPCWTSLTDRRLKSGSKYLEVEEKLANAYMLRTLRHSWPISVQRSIDEFIKIQPTGYNEAGKFLEDKFFLEELSELTKAYIGLHGIEKDLDLFTNAFDYSVFFPVIPRIDSSQCPLHIIHDEDMLGIPSVAIEYIKCIPKIIETAKFKKALSKIDSSIQKKWAQKKALLAQMVPGHPEFEKLKGDLNGLFSIRLNKGFRAHLKPMKEKSTWEAVAIGSHSKIGHG